MINMLIKSFSYSSGTIFSRIKKEWSYVYPYTPPQTAGRPCLFYMNILVNQPVPEV